MCSMFRQKKEGTALPLPAEASQPAPAGLSPDTPVSHFDHPQVLLLDVDTASELALREAGFNISTGSFGTPYKIAARDGMQQVIENGHLPANYTEQEIIIADLVSRPPTDLGRGQTASSPRQASWWTRADTGLIDPRPSFMSTFRGDFDRTVEYGGVFVIFADARHNEGNFVFGHLGRDAFGRDQFMREDFYCDNWSMLSLLAPYALVASFATGRDIRPIEATGHRSFDTLSRTIADHLSTASFSCTMQPRTYQLKERWVPLATNRFGEAVATLIVPEEEAKGWVLLLPNLDDRPRFLKRLLVGVLPEMAPQLFPHVEGARWVEHSEYELPGVLDLKGHIRQVEEEARVRVGELEERITATRHDLGYLHDLLTEQGRPLVEAVKRTLEMLGFRNVVDVDAELVAAGQPDKDEDLRIEDGSPLVLVEVKGVRGTSSDDDALQVAKHIAPRMKKLGRTDVKGLVIINHQRHLPALEREQDPFRDLVVTSATEQDIGLMTAWDLYRVTRSFLANGWTHEHVRDLFYRSGRIRPLPDHYGPLGTVEKFRDKIGVVSVRLNEGELGLHDRIAFDLPWGFEEHVVESLQVEGAPVDPAPEGSLAGIKTPLTKEKAKPGTRVYKVATSAQTPSVATSQVPAEDAQQ